ncbi:ABC transporter substrate-binding protein [Chroogloeocystis siderophila]|jgi:ABC-type Fe3+-hydroxamate transport system substrate-binding protein|uniref:Fe/B12 periplasmic-binding domain-containing protein n=1 Tax=Chroogloeocystis siderophila 5.2 s.c.1 TaxID=247279 RepID=A0A1U7HZS3_9CHRO|nr:ABC transporter substrate-binding protein [Chroogloeocystis siderophila]OKH29096.1 hypothetical protein NIES1031_00365 [Chroogloeocystis siderophila 5.2 s.c.1]
MRIDLFNASLALPDGGEFQQANPTEEIVFVSVTRVGNLVRVAITGLDAPPGVEVSISPQFVLSVTPSSDTVAKVAALIPHILDSILALGVQPAAYAETVRLNLPRFDNPATQIPHLGNRITTQPVNLGDRQNPSLEALVQLKPDVIIGERWLHQDEYHLLTKIAPTLLFDDTKGEKQHWTNDITGIAQVLGREDAAQNINRSISATASIRQNFGNDIRIFTLFMPYYPTFTIFLLRT